MVSNTDSYIVSWRAWFDNGISTPVEYNSIQHNWNTIPSDGLQAIRLWYNDNKSRYISGNDFYFFQDHPGGLVVGQTNDPYQSIVDRYPGAVIKLGKHCPDIMIRQINDLMVASINPLYDSKLK